MRLGSARIQNFLRINKLYSEPGPKCRGLRCDQRGGYSMKHHYPINLSGKISSRQDLTSWFGVPILLKMQLLCSEVVFALHLRFHTSSSKIEWISFEDPRMQHQFVRQKQMTHPAIPNSDTLIDASVTVCPLRIDQGSSHFLGETT